MGNGEGLGMRLATCENVYIHVCSVNVAAHTHTNTIYAWVGLYRYMNMFEEHCN